MVKIKFLYNRQKDASNWVDVTKDVDPSFGISYKDSVRQVPLDLRKKILRSSRKEGIKAVLGYFRKNSWRVLKEDFLKLKQEALTKIWKKKGNLLIKRLEELTQRKFPRKNYTAFLTTLYICAYDFKKGYFYLSLYHSLAVNFMVIAHELLHFLTYAYFQKYCLRNGLSEKQFQNLKESLTVLLNTDLFQRDVLLIEDNGYKPHQKMRRFIWKSWEEERDFEEVVRLATEKMRKGNF